MGAGHRGRVRRRYPDKQGDTVGNSGLFPLGILEVSEGYAPEGYHVMGEKVGVLIYLHLGTPQPCHPWAQLLQHPEPAHSPSVTGACSRKPSRMARVRATVGGASVAPYSPLLVCKALHPTPQPANAWSRAYEMERMNEVVPGSQLLYTGKSGSETSNSKA